MTDSAFIMLFVKAPQRGRVKSRLAAALGEDAALEIYRAFVKDMVDTLDRVALRTTICVDPPESLPAVSVWLGERRSYEVQIGPDLGERMEHAFRSAFNNGSTRAVLIGSDFPDLPAEILTRAIEELERHDAVIGPAADGGYYLIGFRSGSFRPEVFRDIRWSTPAVFEETMSIFARTGSRVHILPQWQDVDTIDDLRNLYERNKGTDFERSCTMPILRKVCGKPE